ncbi:MAG: ankyrin repeat domain-containing protein [Planctomycetes bacterium]|nr:ankyrin repeat domain-containing protein [Planctomycetota bacterium]
MGDCDFLYGMKSEKPLGSRKKDWGVIMCAETDCDMRVPLLWGALFTPQDCQTKQWTLAGKRHSLSVWHTSLASGLENLSRHMPWILQHTHPALHPFVRAFEQAMAACKYPYLQLDMEALSAWLSHDRATVDGRVRQCLDALESEDGWAGYSGGALITNTYDLYGMRFLFADWSPLQKQVGWCSVGEDRKIQKEGCPGSVLEVGEEEHEKDPLLPLFFDACVRGDLPAVTSLLASGQDVNARVDLPREANVSALILAASHGKTEIVRELIKAGADVNAQSQSGAFALGLAAEDGYAEIVEALLTAGADVDMRNHDGWNSMMMAVVHKRHLVQELLAAAKTGGAKAGESGEGRAPRGG